MRIVSYTMRFFRRILVNGFMIIKEAAQEWGISERRINTLCQSGRIQGISKFGKS